MSEWDDPAAYRYITEELLDEEMDDIRIEGTYVHFDTATPEYDVQMWVEEFVWDVFHQEREYFLPGLKKQPLFDENGAPLAFADFATKLEAVWTHLPEMEHVEVIPSKIEVAGATAIVVASIAWTADSELQQIDAFFRLQPSPYGGWDVVHTSLLDDLLALVST